MSHGSPWSYICDKLLPGAEKTPRKPRHQSPKSTPEQVAAHKNWRPAAPYPTWRRLYSSRKLSWPLPFLGRKSLFWLNTLHHFRTPCVCPPPQWKFASEEVAMEHAFFSSFLSEFFLFAESWLDFIGLQSDSTKSLSHPMAHPMVTMDYGIQTGLVIMPPGLWFSWLYISPLFSYSLY